MDILLTGGSGFIGQALNTYFLQQGHAVFFLRRGSSTPPYWEPNREIINLGGHHFDVVIHLAGENIVTGRWTEKKKAEILTSRVQGTKCISEFFSQEANRPELLICSSAVGIYGNCGAETLIETTPPGHGFLAQVCTQWEAALTPLVSAGVRVVSMRLGMVLDSGGGALAKMLLPFRMGLGGVVGDGDQYMSWMTLIDVVHAIDYIISGKSLAGPINFSSPQPVINRQFTKILGRHLHRPTFIPLPAGVTKIVFGEMAEALLLSSTRVLPSKLIKAGYQFRHPTLESALTTMI